MNESVREQVLALAQEELGDELPPVDGDLSELLDSVQRLSLVVAIEDHFKVAFEPEDDDARTLDDVVSIVERHLLLERYLDTGA